MNNIILIGFMGSGKTSCGREAAKLSGRDFCDTDELIERQQKMSISDIFEKFGEPYFRELETGLIKSLIGKDVGVLSVGGGLAVTEGNGDLLKQIGTVIYLRAGIDCLVERLRGDDTRPLLSGGSIEDKIINLMNLRERAYIEASDIIIDTDGFSVEEVAAMILSEVV